MKIVLTDDDSSRVDLGNGQWYSIAVDTLIPLNRIVEISGKSRTTVDRWIREGKFPKPHFSFGGKTNRWVERLVLDFIRDHWIVKA